MLISQNVQLGSVPFCTFGSFFKLTTGEIAGLEFELGGAEINKVGAGEDGVIGVS